MKRALENLGLKVYAPRAGRFLDSDEAKAMFGLFLQILGKPEEGEYGGAYREYHNWLREAMDVAKAMMEEDERLSTFVEAKKN